MIALKIIGSGSLYWADHLRIWQSKASTLTPVCCATRPVYSRSGVQTPASATAPASPLALMLPPLVTPLVLFEPLVVVPRMLLRLAPLPEAPLPSHPPIPTALARIAASTR